jgi:methylglutaconyl-CoA hydratase
VRNALWKDDQMTNPIADPFVEGVDVSPTSDEVRIEATAEGAATVVMNRPARRNALGPDMFAALNEAFKTLAGAEGVRVVFLRGAGGSFSAGGDLQWMRESVERAEDENREDAMALARMLQAWHDLPQLTVALIDGPAFGAGAGFAAAADLAIATAASTFSFSEAKLGLIPTMLAPYVVRAIGPRRSRGLFATARIFDAAYAERIGLIDEVVADAVALKAAADRIAGQILACAPDAVAGCKRLVEDVVGRHLDHGLMEEMARRNAAARVSEEGQAGVRAFLGRRSPPWAQSD